MSRRFALGLASMTLLVVACASPEPMQVEGGQSAQTVEVVASNFAFSPTSIDATAGDQISLLLVNEDDVEHSFTIDDVVDIEAHGGEDASDSFTAPDSTVEFYCRYHPDVMRGEVTIAGSSGADTGGGGTMDDQDIDY